MESMISDVQKRIRVGTHGEDYGSWMSNLVFYVFGGLALTWPEARITGLDYWGAMYNYSQALCERNAASEGVGKQRVFVLRDSMKPQMCTAT